MSLAQICLPPEFFGIKWHAVMKTWFLQINYLHMSVYWRQNPLNTWGNLRAMPNSDLSGCIETPELEPTPQGWLHFCWNKRSWGDQWDVNPKQNLQFLSQAPDRASGSAKSLEASDLSRSRWKWWFQEAAATPHCLILRSQCPSPVARSDAWPGDPFMNFIVITS